MLENSNRLPPHEVTLNWAVEVLPLANWYRFNVFEAYEFIVGFIVPVTKVGALYFGFTFSVRSSPPQVFFIVNSTHSDEIPFTFAAFNAIVSELEYVGGVTPVSARGLPALFGVLGVFAISD